LPALRREQTWSLFSPETSAIVSAERLEYQARRFFSATLVVEQHKVYPQGAWPRYDVIRLSLGGQAIELRTLPIEAADELRRQAERAAAAMGGAGMDVVLARARRVWQVETDFAHATVPALTTLAVLASLWLGPILPPRHDRLLGVKGARERLAEAAQGQG
jgi:hypothetical protein